MKLRIKGNSVRLRLQRCEVSQLSESGRVSESLILGPSLENTFEYVLATCPGDSIRLSQDGHMLTVSLPSTWASTLATTERVGYDVCVTTAPGVEVRVIIEKDFQCLMERPGEQNEDTFPNPESGTCAPPVDKS